MKRILFAIPCLVIGTQLRAQEFPNKDLQAMVSAEYDFAKLANDKNVREAFLTYLTDESVTFAQGPVIGRKKWEGESSLAWEPDYADIAGSGDFGYTCGPWEFRAKRTDEIPVAYGHFVSVWQKQSHGEWRNILDIGISHIKPEEKNTLKTSAITFNRTQRKSAKNSKSDLIKTERHFLAALSNDGTKAYAGVLSTEARFYRRGGMPYTTPSAVRDLLKEGGPKITFALIEGNAASTGDMGYVYGTATVEEVKDGKPAILQANYARIWKKEDGKHWKIVLELVSTW
jgi:ketosteroid isomerase-like protein